MNYVKLSELVGDQFTVEKVWGYKWKKYDQDQKKMLVAKRYEPGYRKVYDVDTNKGKLNLGTGQIGSLLEVVFKDGVADLNGKTFEVKSNGKSGMDIRYYFNLSREVKPLADVELNGRDPEFESLIEEIPF